MTFTVIRCTRTTKGRRQTSFSERLFHKRVHACLRHESKSVALLLGQCHSRGTPSVFDQMSGGQTPETDRTIHVCTHERIVVQESAGFRSNTTSRVCIEGDGKR